MEEEPLVAILGQADKFEDLGEVSRRPCPARVPGEDDSIARSVVLGNVACFLLASG